MRYITKSERESQKLARKILKNYPQSKIFLLVGDLGSGKTQFVKGLARALKIKELVLSPTFNYQNIYATDGGKRLNHFDLYREDTLDADIALLLGDSFADKEAYTAVEWAERCKGIWPKDALTLEFRWISEKEREIKVLGRNND